MAAAASATERNEALFSYQSVVSRSLEEITESVDLTIPADAVLTKCGHLHSEARLREMLGRVADAERRAIACPNCRGELSERDFQPVPAIRDMALALRSIGIASAEDLGALGGTPTDGASLIRKIKHMESAILHLTLRDVRRQQLLDRTVEKLGIQTQRVQNMMALTSGELALTLIPRGCGGQTMELYADAGLDLRQLNLVARPDPVEAPLPALPLVPEPVERKA